MKMKKSLGILETEGVLSAIAALDKMLNSADIEVIKKTVTGNLNTVFIIGEIAGVKTALDEGVKTARKFSRNVISHLISSPHKQLIKIIPELELLQKTKIEETPIALEEEVKVEETAEIKTESEINEKAADEPVIEDQEAEEEITNEVTDEESHAEINAEDDLSEADTDKISIPDSEFEKKENEIKITEDILSSDDDAVEFQNEPIEEKIYTSEDFEILEGEIPDYDEELEISAKENYKIEEEVIISKPEVVNQTDYVKKELNEEVLSDPEEKPFLLKDSEVEEPEVKNVQEESLFEFGLFANEEPEVIQEPVPMEMQSEKENENDLTEKEETVENRVQESINSVNERFDLAEMETMSVPELRKLARGVEDFPIKGREISKANKKILLEYFRNL